MVPSSDSSDRLPADLPSFDDAALDRLRRFGGAKLLGEMITLFLAGAPERLTAARAGLDASDAPEVELALHSLKSSSAQLGAMRMQRLSEEGELLARAGTLAAVRSIVQNLQEELVSVHEWLTRVREGGAA